MRIMYQRCCGIDVHKKMIVACLLMSSVKASPEGDPDIQHDAVGSLSAARVAHSSGLRGRGDGEYWCLLEVYLECAGRGDGATAVQCSTYQGCARAKNGYQGRRMDRRLAPAWEARKPVLCLPVPNENCGI